MVWPPQSPDLHIMESVWDYMKRHEAAETPKSTEQQVWRLCCCFKSKAPHIKYWFNLVFFSLLHCKSIYLKQFLIIRIFIIFCKHLHFTFSAYNFCTVYVAFQTQQPPVGCELMFLPSLSTLCCAKLNKSSKLNGKIGSWSMHSRITWVFSDLMTLPSSFPVTTMFQCFGKG